MVQKNALIFLRYQDPASPMQKTGLTLYFYPSFLDWYYLFCNSVSLLDVITRAQSTIIFLCVRHFWHGGEHQTNQVILEQACSWPVRIQSFAIRMYQRKYSYNAFIKGKLMCKKDCSGSFKCSGQFVHILKDEDLECDQLLLAKLHLWVRRPITDWLIQSGAFLGHQGCESPNHIFEKVIWSFDIAIVVYHVQYWERVL